MMNVTGNHRLLIANITSDAMHSVTVVTNACNSSTNWEECGITDEFENSQ